MARSRSRRLVLTICIVLFLAAVGVGVAYLLKRGRGSSDPFLAAMAAREGGDLARAEALAKALLADDPAHDRARALLIHLLAISDRMPEAEAQARYWRERPADEVKGLRALSELALHRGDTAGAVRLARMLADRDPAFSQAMLMQVQDLRGTPADREGSVRAAEALGRLTPAPGVRANAFLYAAETLRDLERESPEGPRKVALADRRELDRREARAAAMTRLDPRSSNLMSPTASKALMGRIELLSRDTEERKGGLQKLEALLVEQPDQHAARAALLGHYLFEGDVAKALAHARLLGDAPPLVALRAVGALASTGEFAAALEILDTLSSIPEAARKHLRARLLIAGDGAGRAEGLSALEGLARADPSNVELVREVAARIRDSGDEERALALLEDLAAGEERLRVVALVERIVALQRKGDTARLDEAFTRLARLVTLADLPGVYSRLQRDPTSDESIGIDFLGRVLASGSVDAREVRLLRAAACLSRPGSTADGRSWADAARDDLLVVAGDAEATTKVLVRAATLCVAAGHFDVAGGLLARALTSPEDGSQALELFLRAVGDPDAIHRATMADALRSGDPARGPHGAWLEGLATALVARDSGLLRRGAAAPIPASAGPEQVESALQLLLAARAGDWPEAEAYARMRLKAGWEPAKAQEHLGAVLLDAKKYDAVLSLHEGASVPPECRGQRVRALLGLKRTVEAVAEARRLVEETEASDNALILLAKALRGLDPDAALAAASAAPGSIPGAFLRAELLEAKGEEDAAILIFEDMLRASHDQSLPAWYGIARLRTAQGRDDDLIRRLTTTIEHPPAGMRIQDAAPLFLLRGQAHERRNAYEAALADYRQVLAFAPQHAVALNNAAWLMSAGLVRQSGDPQAWQEHALELINRAVGVAPNAAPLHHTRAKVLKAMGRHEDALAAVDRALSLLALESATTRSGAAPHAEAAALRGREATYLVDKAALLRLLDREEEARALYQRVVNEYAGSYPATQAAQALGE